MLFSLEKKRCLTGDRSDWNHAIRGPPVPVFPHNIGIRLARLFFCCILMMLCVYPDGCLNLAETACRAETKQRQDTTKKIQSGQSYFYIMRKVWCHQVWIQNNLDRYHCAHPNFHELLSIHFLYVIWTKNVKLQHENFVKM